jgi:hypothetical protein
MAVEVVKIPTLRVVTLEILVADSGNVFDEAYFLSSIQTMLTKTEDDLGVDEICDVRVSHIQTQDGKEIESIQKYKFVEIDHALHNENGCKSSGSRPRSFRPSLW